MPIIFSGDDDFIKAMQKKAKALESKSKKERILKAGAEPIQKATIAHVPVGVKNTQRWQYKAGKKYAVEHLKDNIIVSGVTEDGVIFIGAEEHFFYASFLEFGTVNMKSQPFAEPGFLEGRQEGLQAMADETKKVIEDG